MDLPLRLFSEYRSPQLDTRVYTYPREVRSESLKPRQSESISHAIAKVRDIYERELASFHSIDVRDKHEVAAVTEILTNLIDTDFDAVEGLEYGDRIEASGSTVALVYDSARPDIEYMFLNDDTRLIGTFSEFVVAEVPSVCDIDNLETYHATNSKDRVLTNRFGLTARVKDSEVVGSGKRREFSETCLVLLPLQYPHLQLKRYR